MLSRRHFLLTSSLLAGCSQRAEPDPYWLGHIGPLSGPERQAGEHWRRGIQIALGEANAVAARKLSVLHADNRGQIERSRSEAIRLVSLNRLLAMVGGLQLTEADRLALALQPYPTILITPSPHSSVGLENTLSLDVSAKFRGFSLAKFAGDHFKASKAVLLIDETSTFCANIGIAFAESWRTAGHVAHTWNATGEENATTLVERLKKVEADVILFAGSAKDFLATRRTLATGKVTTPMLFGGESAEWQRVEEKAEVGRDVFAGAILVTSRLEEAGKKFLTKYKETYREEADIHACLGFEAINVLALPIRELKGGRAAKLLKELKEAKELPCLNGSLTFNEGHAVRPLYIVRARDPNPMETLTP